MRRLEEGRVGEGIKILNHTKETGVESERTSMMEGGWEEGYEEIVLRWEVWGVVRKEGL